MGNLNKMQISLRLQSVKKMLTTNFEMTRKFKEKKEESETKRKISQRTDQVLWGNAFVFQLIGNTSDHTVWKNII